MIEKLAKFDVAKHRFNEEFAFRVRNRRNRLLGLWVATRLGFRDDAVEAFAKWVLGTGIDLPDDQKLARRIANRCEEIGSPLTSIAIRTEMDRLGAIAALEFAAVEPPLPSRAA
ncbi:MAG: ATPase inhibitor subunit zeta [Rhodospirillales bacterium]